MSVRLFLVRFPLLLAVVGLVGFVAAGSARLVQRAPEAALPLEVARSRFTVERLTPGTAHTTIQWELHEIARMPRAVLLTAGASLQLHILEKNAIIRTGGTWSADAGEITPLGLYTAPRFLPLFGLDTITYTDSSGETVEVLVRILPDPKRPESATTPVVRVSDNDHTLNTAPLPHTVEVLNAAHLGILDPVTVPLAPGESLPEMREYLNPEYLPTFTIGGIAYQRLPSVGHSFKDSPVVAVAQRFLRFARLAPTATPEIIASRQNKP